MSAQDKYQVLDPLTDEEYEDLRDDIAEHGVMVPVTIDENGDILDGHHRMRAAEETGKECPTFVVAGLTEDEKVDRAFSLNLKRRHMNNAQKRDAIGRYLRRRPEASDRLAAEVIGVTDKTVATVRKSLTAEIPQLAPSRGGPGNRTRKPEDRAAAAKRAAELEKSRAAGEKRQAKRDAERAEDEALTAAHMAPGGVMQGKRQVRAVATQDRIRAALTDCIVALTRALADPGLDEDLADAEQALPNDDLRIVGKSAQVRRLARELDKRLGELKRAAKTSRTERDSADRQ